MPCSARLGCAPFCAHAPSRTIAHGSRRGSVQIACTGAKNQHDSRSSQSVIIAIFGTHNPLVVGSNPTGPTVCFRSGPETWVTQCTDYIGDTLRPNGFSSG